VLHVLLRFQPILLSLLQAAVPPAAQPGPGTGDVAPHAIPAGEQAVTDTLLVRGMTISCQGWGGEWGSDAFATELSDLARMGVNWVAIHPYCSIRADGTIEARRLDPAAPPGWITRPIREAHARHMAILIIPHVAYWGTGWSWRGAIDFADPGARARFFATYQRFLVDVATCARGADALSIGNELEKLVVHDAEWRTLIAAVRAATDAKLTYAADWSAYEHVPFWDALDAIGIDAYFPLCESAEPTEASLREGWSTILPRLRALHERTGKPVVFTELGYNCSLDAARTPWAYSQARGPDHARAESLQTLCLRVALDEIGAQSEWLRGAFLWKWFVGRTGRENFLAKTPAMRAAIAGAWGSGSR
jgi:hypothetical protein